MSNSNIPTKCLVLIPGKYCVPWQWRQDWKIILASIYWIVQKTSFSMHFVQSWNLLCFMKSNISTKSKVDIYFQGRYCVLLQCRDEWTRMLVPIYSICAENFFYVFCATQAGIDKNFDAYIQHLCKFQASSNLLKKQSCNKIHV